MSATTLPIVRSWKLTRAEVEDMRDIAREKGGVDLIDDSGSATKMGVTIEYEYKDEVLTLSAVDKVWYVKMSWIENYLDKFETYMAKK